MQGRLHLDDWISDRIRLDEINEGFRAMKAGKVVRSIVDFGIAA
jgi:S-(hydroxymethyl)glutathione dehydrogenase / alcohol dehydrogenase